MLHSLTRAVTVCLALHALPAGAQDWEEAARKITRRAPEAFPKLPRAVRKGLTERGCAIPQSFAEKAPHNILRGEFARKGQMDHAVLCSRNGRSSIIVFWGGPAGCKESEIAEAEDVHSLQGREDGKIEYSRKIDKVDALFIRKHFDAYGGTKPPDRIDHLGIDDQVLGKASVVRYCHAGEWLFLTGAD